MLGDDVLSADGTGQMTYIIRHKATQKQWKSSSGKSSWATAGHAKSAFKNAYWYPSQKHQWGISPTALMCKFDDQDIFEIVELIPKEEANLQLASQLLKEVYEREMKISWSLADKIEKFLDSIGEKVSHEEH